MLHGTPGCPMHQSILTGVENRVGVYRSSKKNVESEYRLGTKMQFEANVVTLRKYCYGEH